MSRILRLLGVAAVLVGMIGLRVQPVQAADFVKTIAPGEKVTIALDLWCLDPAQLFPTAILGPTARPPDAVVKVMQTAIKKGTVTSDVYQTQLAIWRAVTGAFRDPAGKGTVLAEEIWKEAQSATIAALPTDVVLLDDAVKAGNLKVTIANFVSIPVVGIPGKPFHGKADLVVENVSAQNVKFVLVEGSVFQPVGGVGQPLISHQQAPAMPSTLPATGSGAGIPGLVVAIPVAFGFLLMLAGTALRRAAR